MTMAAAAFVGHGMNSACLNSRRVHLIPGTSGDIGASEELTAFVNVSWRQRRSVKLHRSIFFVRSVWSNGRQIQAHMW